MNIIERIKALFSKKEQIPLLTETGKPTPPPNVMNAYRVSLLKIQEPRFQECVEEFIKQYKDEDINDKSSKDKVYHAFIKMFCSNEEEPGKNPRIQEKLTKKVEKEGYQIGYQYSGDRCKFIHICGDKGIDEYKDKDMEKIYLNCERKNIAALTLAIFDGIKGIVGDKLQLKYVSEQFLEEGKKQEEKAATKNYQRNDKIVIYAQNHEMAEKIAAKINEIRTQRPELFSPQKRLPFIPKKYGIIGIAQKKNYEYAKTPLGEVTGSTYNDYIANVLKTCIVAGFDREMEADENTREGIDERMSIYSKIYEDMPLEQRARIIGNIKEIFEKISRENSINTVYSKKQPDSEKEKN